MRKQIVFGTLLLFVISGACWFWFTRSQPKLEEVDHRTPEVREQPAESNQTKLVTLDEISSEKLFEILAKPRPRPILVVTNQYNGAREVQPFIESTIVEQANRCNAVFRFATAPDGSLKTLSLEDLAYGATTMTGTFKFNFLVKPEMNFAVYFDHGDFTGFADTRYDSDVFDRNMMKYEALHRATNYVTKEQAVKLVEETLYKLGYTRQHLKPFGQPYVRHLAFTRDGKQQILPYFFIDYRDPDSESEPKAALLSAEVLGIEPGGRITQLLDAYWKTPRIQVPAGYPEKVEGHWRSQGKTPPRY